MFDVKITVEDETTMQSTTWKNIDQYEAEELVEQMQDLKYEDYDYIEIKIEKVEK